MSTPGYRRSVMTTGVAPTPTPATFSPALIEMLILHPLQWFFSEYGQNHSLKWDPDPKKTQIQIIAQDDDNLIESEFKARIVVSRGGFAAENFSLGGGLAEKDPLDQTGGLNISKQFILYKGEPVITIESRNKGVCEMIADIVTHLIVWSRPLICDIQGFKEFGLPISVSPSSKGEKEDVDKFRCQISFPYIKEELWQNSQIGMKLKGVLQNFVPMS